MVFVGITKKFVIAENRNQLENRIKRVIKNMKLQEPEIFKNLFKNRKEKIIHANSPFR